MPHPDELAWMSQGTCVQVGAKRWESLPLLIQRRGCQVCPVRADCRDFMSGTFRGEWKPRQVAR